MKSLAAFSLFGSLINICLSAAPETVDDQHRLFWETENPKIDPAMLPLRIDVKTYDDYVVDPNTNQMYKGLPWVIFFYHEPCGFCKIFKPEFEKIASKN